MPKYLIVRELEKVVDAPSLQDAEDLADQLDNHEFVRIDQHVNETFPR